MSHHEVKLVLAGNPNVGKSTLFNTLTGTNQHVGNYPGVTVEKRVGHLIYSDHSVVINDLPGIYSLSAFSPEEIVARNVIAEENIDVVVNIIDSSNLEKNLYLTLQLLEMGLPVVIFLNMADIAEKNGVKVDVAKLSKIFGVPVISGQARDKKGVNELLREAFIIHEEKLPPPEFSYSDIMESYIAKVMKIIALHDVSMAHKWIAVKLLENDSQCKALFPHKVWERIDAVKAEMAKENGSSPVAMVVRERYEIINSIVSSTIISKEKKKAGITSKLDKILLGDFFAVPFFIFSMFLLFQLVFKLGTPFADMLETFFDWLAVSVSSLWGANQDSYLRSLIVNGVIRGVGGVLVFTPNIFLMFFGIAFLEESGYMSRVAVIMDKYMSRIGLSGKSFVPMVLGFGCSVPAIMGTRIIENRWERIATILAIPFMSCGARLPVFILFVSIFIAPEYQSLALLLLYVIGIFIGLIVAKVLRKTLLSGDENPLIIELPRYMLPSFKMLLMQTWERGEHFIKKAGTIILASSIILWALNTFPVLDESKLDAGYSESQISAMKLEYSSMGRIGKFLEPIFRPMGGDWKISSAFVASIAAKEVVVSELKMLYSDNNGKNGTKTFREALRDKYSVFAAIAFTLFTLLSAPCIATFAVTKVETASWRWPIFQLFMMTVIAYLFSVAFFQVATFISGG